MENEEIIEPVEDVPSEEEVIESVEAPVEEVVE